MIGIYKYNNSENNFRNYKLCFSTYSKGYFIDPTIVESTDPKNKLMEEVRM